MLLCLKLGIALVIGKGLILLDFKELHSSCIPK